LSIKSTFVERASLRCQGAGVCVITYFLKRPREVQGMIEL
jgi:hypothetical protein